MTDFDTTSQQSVALMMMSKRLGLAFFEFLVTAIMQSPASADDSYAHVEACAISVQTHSDAAPTEVSATPPPSRQELLRAADRKLHALREAGTYFLAAYPTDPRRHQVALWLLQHQPIFLANEQPAENVANHSAHWKPAIDLAGEARWDDKLARILAELEAVSDLSPDMVRERTKVAFNRAFWQADRQRYEKKPFDLAKLRRRLLAWLAYLETPEQHNGLVPVLDYFAFVDALNDPARAQAEYEIFANSPNEQIREAVEFKLNRLALMEDPVELTSTAIDGRQVDLASLRGKVVLLDFWATWCVKCVHELPTVKAAYANLHDRGFEIIGISLDRAGNQEKLTSFVTAEQMPWPQLYDDKKPNKGRSSVAGRFGVTGVPDLFLLDRNGMIAQTRVTFDELEQRVQELLDR